MKKILFISLLIGIGVLMTRCTPKSETAAEEDTASQSLPAFAAYHLISKEVSDSIKMAIEQATDSRMENDRHNKWSATQLCNSRYAYSDNPCVESDWLWHSKMMELGVNIDSLVRAEIQSIYDNQPGMNKMAFLSETNAWLHLMDKLKEAIDLTELDWMKEAYMQDYQLWLELGRDILAMNVANYSAWPQDAYNTSLWLAELRQELLEEEMTYLKGEDYFDWMVADHLFTFDCTDWVLEKWFNSRLEAAERHEKIFNATYFRKMTYKIAYTFKQRKTELEWYSR